MSINALQTVLPAHFLPEPGTQKKDNSAPASFEALLQSRSSTGASPTRLSRQEVERAAAELFRIQMMHTSLALGGGDTAPPAEGFPALEALLAAPAPFIPGVRTAARPAAGAVAAAKGTQAAASGAGVGYAATEIETTAARYLGTPYRFGGESADGIDCSSFVQQVFREHQVDLPRTAREQSRVGSEVPPEELKKGDLLFFHTYASYPSHVGIYLGDGRMIHASSEKGQVTVSDLNSNYYRSRFLGARRVA